MKFLCFDDLKPTKGIPDSKTTLWRKENQERFPKRSRFGDRAYGWPEDIIDAYLATIAAGRTEEEATAIAEGVRATRYRVAEAV